MTSVLDAPARESQFGDYWLSTKLCFSVLSLAQQLYIKKQGSVRRDDPSSTPLAIP